MNNLCLYARGEEGLVIGRGRGRGRGRTDIRHTHKGEVNSIGSEIGNTIVDGQRQRDCLSNGSQIGREAGDCVVVHHSCRDTGCTESAFQVVLVGTVQIQG